MKKEQLEFSILEFNRSGFSFRAIKEHRDSILKEKPSFLLRFFQFAETSYMEVKVEKAELFLKEEMGFYDIWQVDVKENPAYEKAAEQLTREYMRYIHLYLEEDPAVLSQELTGYPAEREDSYPTSLQELKRDAGTAFHEYVDKIRSDLRGVEQGLVLDTPWKYERYLQDPLSHFAEWYLKDSGITEMLFREEELSVLYMGSQICMNLMPDEDTLLALLKKCILEQKKPVIQFPPVKEHQMERMIRLLDRVEAFVKAQGDTNLEVVVNDLGMLSLVSERKCFAITLGILLLKQKKDPRYFWKKGTGAYLTEQDLPGWMNERFRDHVRTEYGVTGYIVESCQMNEICLGERSQGERITVFAPWYQMNTSTLCPLYAAVKEGDRGYQKEVDNCGRICREHTFLYPSHLHMCGRYNSTWGYDVDSMAKIVERGTDRMVWNFNL